MRKFFTLAAAAVMAFTASAGTVVRTQMPALCSVASDAQKQMRQEVVATHEFLSRGEEEGIPLEGKYFYAVYYAIPDDSGQQALGEAIETVGYFEIVKDADVENGYFIKNFMGDFFNKGLDEENKYEFADIKATFDPATNVLTIPGGQFLFSAEEEDDKTGEVFEAKNHLIAGVDGQLWDYDDPLQLKWNDGRIYMTSDAYIIGEISIKDDGQKYLSAYRYLYMAFSSYIPNGSLNCFMSGLNETKDFPILGVWKDSAFFVMNFTGCDPLHYAALLYNQTTGTVKGSNRYNPDGYAGWALTILPADFTGGSAVEINYKLNPAFMDETGMPIGKGWEIEGTVVEAGAENVVVEFPTYGLFDLNDILFAEIKDAVLTFKPNAIAGIETIEAADNTNAPVVYYNLQGQRVNNPANGIFIRQQGTNATKVLVK